MRLAALVIGLVLTFALAPQGAARSSGTVAPVPSAGRALGPAFLTHGVDALAQVGW